MKITKSQLKQIIKEELGRTDYRTEFEIIARDLGEISRMKITKTQLKQIIKEELESTINEDGHTDVPSAMRKLKTATEDAVQILRALEGRPDEELPSWWMSKLTLASDYLNKARDYLIVPSETMEE